MDHPRSSRVRSRLESGCESCELVYIHFRLKIAIDVIDDAPDLPRCKSVGAIRDLMRCLNTVQFIDQERGCHAQAPPRRMAIDIK